MYRPHSSNQSFFINQPIPAECSVPQQRFQNYSEMREAIMLEIEKEKRRNREIESEMNRMQRDLLPPGSEYGLIRASISLPMPRHFAPPRSNYGLVGDLIVPQQDDGMSLEERLARNCGEKRLMEKSIALRQRYGG